LPQQATAARAKRRASGELRRARRAARQQQVADVDRRDEQERHDHAEDNRQRFVERVTQGAQSLATRQQANAEVGGLRPHASRRNRRLRLGRLDRLVQRGQL
jgi:hypothetical protein